VRRLIGAALLAAAALAAFRALRGHGGAVASEGNGHPADRDRIELLRERIDAARKRLQDEIDSVRGQ
jgi:hypothetical protein